jgi:hypothetical protein
MRRRSGQIEQDFRFAFEAESFLAQFLRRNIRREYPRDENRRKQPDLESSYDHLSFQSIALAEAHAVVGYPLLERDLWDRI